MSSALMEPRKETSGWQEQAGFSMTLEKMYRSYSLGALAKPLKTKQRNIPSTKDYV
jgi:hypothetical protein